MGVSAGDGMIHYVLLTRDGVGRSVVESRVIDVDQTDGLDAAGRVNAGIDLMLDAAREADQKVGPIGIAARTATQRRRLRSSGTGPRRQVHLSSDEEAVVAYLIGSGEIDRFATVVVADCGDTGMSLYTVEPSTGRISDIERSHVLSGRRLDRTIAGNVAATMNPADLRTGRGGRASLLSLCRTAKEEVGAGDSTSEAAVELSAGGVDRMRLTPGVVESAARPMVIDARAVVTRYLADAARRGSRPEAVVLVGGLANLPVVRELADSSGVDVVTPPAPELAAATGAAMLAASSSGAASRLAFIGGRRQRQWWSAAPVAIVGAVLAAALLTIYAVSSSLTGQTDSVTTPTEATPASSRVETTDSADTAPVTTGARESHPAPPATQRPVTTTNPDRNAYPGWATTELPQTAPSTTTRTLSPNPPVYPTTPQPPSTPATPTTPSSPSSPRPSIPGVPDLIPSDLLPRAATPEPTQPTQNRRLPALTPPAPTAPATTTTTPAR